MRTTIAAALAATVFAAPAFAQDTTTPFNGGHIELVGGFERVNGGGEGDNGGLYGIAGGFDFQRGTTVFGIEAEATDSTVEECDAGICVRAGRDLYIGGRAGVVLSEAALLYVKAGYTNARVTAEAAGVSSSTSLDGIRGGAGIEWATGTPLLVKIEYRYSNYEADISRHQGVIGLGVRF